MFDNILFRGTDKNRKQLFIKNGTDKRYDTVMALRHLYDPEAWEQEHDRGVLEYALDHQNPLIAVYKDIEKTKDCVYKLDFNHPNKGLLALVEIEYASCVLF